jgi:aldehyde:ferredoxin oxidoreductase
MAAALKSSGYDAVVIEGELDRPGVLMLEPDGIRLLDAGPLWGQEVTDTEQRLFAETGPYWASMVLGPAAENAVPFATMAHEGHYAGGSGVACALGGKRVKALMVRDTLGVPSRCTGCTLACPAKLSGNAQLAGDLGLDAPTAERLSALAAACSAAGMLPFVEEPLREMAHRTGVGKLLAQGESALLEHLGPEAERFLPALPPRKKRGGVGVADLLGTCQRVWKERPGEVLRSALVATQGLLANAG